jgi:UDP-2-acetamido-2,6-beta-L-arabino-hexul-4-ose reductase
VRALVTGSAGFVGSRIAALLRSEGHEVLTYGSGDPRPVLDEHVAAADFIFHFAGVNRPSDVADFEKVNVGLTEDICDVASRAPGDPVVVLASSTQAVFENPYGVSKRRAELAVQRYARQGKRAAVFRLPNVFGPGCRPNYNSVVATFAHNTARGLPLDIKEPERELTLVYVHDVARAIVDVTANVPVRGEAELREVSPVARTTVGELATRLDAYRRSRADFTVPTVADAFSRKLYATYLSYLGLEDFGYNLATKTDDRGTLAEFLKSSEAGEIFISRTRPGAVRGNHYHHTKAEKFLVVEGQAIIRFRSAEGGGETLEYRVTGTDFRVVDIPPDFTHSIENVGSSDLIVLFWASEIFDSESPDTIPLPVQTTGSPGGALKRTES